MCWQMTQGPGLLEWAGHVPRGGPDLGAPGAPPFSRWGAGAGGSLRQLGARNPGAWPCPGG